MVALQAVVHHGPDEGLVLSRVGLAPPSPSFRGVVLGRHGSAVVTPDAPEAVPPDAPTPTGSAGCHVLTLPVPPQQTQGSIPTAAHPASVRMMDRGKYGT